MGIKPQAVTNWASRYVDTFPVHRAAGDKPQYPVEELAAWLDARPIRVNDRRADEVEGATWGQRFRAALRLPPAPDDLAVQEDQPNSDAAQGSQHFNTSGQLEEELWNLLDRHRRGVLLDDYQDLVLKLLLIQAKDRHAWRALLRSSPIGIEGTLASTCAAVSKIAGVDEAALAALEARARPETILALVRALGSTNGFQGESSSREPQTPRLPAGQAVDFLLDRFAQARRQAPGEFLTPSGIVSLMIELADPSITDRLYNPCCGSGEIAVAAASHIRRQQPDAKPSIRAEALTKRSWATTAVNAALHNVRVDVQLATERPWHRLPQTGNEFDVVVANPPFKESEWAGTESPRTLTWRYGVPPRGNSNYAWLQLAQSCLGPEGRAVVVMPSSAAGSRNPRERAIREAMIAAGVVRSVISLPEGLFRESTVAADLWILAPADSESAPDVLFIDAHRSVKKLGTTYRALTESGRRKILECHQAWTYKNITPEESEFAVAASLDVIRTKGYDLTPVRYLSQMSSRRGSPDQQAGIEELREELRSLSVQATHADTDLDRRLEEIISWTA